MYIYGSIYNKINKKNFNQSILSLIFKPKLCRSTCSEMHEIFPFKRNVRIRKKGSRPGTKNKITILCVWTLNLRTFLIKNILLIKDFIWLRFFQYSDIYHFYHHKCYWKIIWWMKERFEYFLIKKRKKNYILFQSIK